MNKTRYVLGFMFSPDKYNVALIQKKKPEWQKDHLNGIGGKIEEGETTLNAMVREFREETGCNTSESSWKEVGVMSGDFGCVYVFKCIGTQEEFESLTTTTEEQIHKIHLSNLLSYKIISNLPWLIYMCLDDSGVYLTAEYTEVRPNKYFISSNDIKDMNNEIMEKVQSLWEGAELEESYDAITLDDLNGVLKKYLP